MPIKPKNTPPYYETTQPVKVYWATNIQQAETSAPTMDILENTIGNVIWSRASAGYYKGTLAGAFPVNKTICTFSNGENRVISVYPEGDTIEIYQVVEYSGSQVATDNIYNGTLQILVYP